MARTVDSLTPKIESANVAMNELRAMFARAEVEAEKFNLAISAVNARLEEMKARKAALGELIRDPGTTDDDKKKARRSSRTLSSQMRSQEETLVELNQLKGNLPVTSKKLDQDMKSIQTITATYKKLREEIKLLSDLQAKGLSTEKAQASIDILMKKLEGQARAAALAEARLRKYINTLNEVRGAAQAGGEGLADGKIFPEEAVVAPPKQPSKSEVKEQERLEALRKLREEYQRVDLYEKSRGMAGRFGFAPETLERVRRTPTTGVRELNYTKPGDMGEIENLKMYIDRAGNILPNTSRQFNTFTSSVARDVVELTKWTIAIGLIYGPLNKLQEMISKLVQNEALLANSMVVLSGTSTEVETVFKTVSNAANMMGEDVGGAIDVFTQAYRATGDLGDQYQRISVATQLMADGMTLAKLSGMQYNEAIDNLVGSLKQAGIPLNEGRQLLDKWVKTSTIANVDVRTLAIGFSVLGESASAAGLNVDQLNGLLAVISENMGTSGAEAANAARAIVSGFESSKAIDAMSLLGISVRTLEGETRPLLEIMTQIQNMKMQGLISPSQFAQLTLAIGGGTRRQAVVAATIEDTAKINKIAAEGANANGAAQDALGRKLDTVQTAATRLNNAFQSLAQTLGDSGGVLDLFQGVLNAVTLVVKAVDSLANAAGKAGPLLAAMLLVRGISRARPDLATNALEMVGGFGNRMLGTSGQKVFNQDSKTWEPLGRGDAAVAGIKRFIPSAESALTPSTLGRSAGVGLAMSALPAILNLSSGNTAGALANIGGGIGGAIVGTVTGMGPVMGSVIGQAISEAFLAGITASKDLSEYVEGKGKTFVGGKEAEGGELEDRLVKILSQNTENLPGFFSKKPLVAEEAVVAAKLAAATESIIAWVGSKLQPGKEFYAPTYQEILLTKATPEARDQYYEELASARSQGLTPEAPGTKTYAQNIQADAAAAASAFSTQLRKSRALELGVELNIGKIKPTDYSSMISQIKAFETVAAGWESTLGEAFRNQNQDIETLEESYQRYIDIMTYGSQEQIGAINSVSNELGEILNQLNYLQGVSASKIEVRTIGGESIEKSAGQWVEYYTTRLQETLEYGANLLSGVSTSAQLQRQPVPSLFNQGETITGTLEQVREWLLRSAAENVQYIKQSTISDQRPEGYTSDEVEAVRASYENVAIGIEEGGELVYRSLLELLEYLNLPKELIGTDWLKKVLDEMIAAGQITVEIKAQEPNLQQPGIPQSMEQTLKAWIEYFETMMRSYGITAQEEAQVVIWEGGQWSTMMANDKAFQLGLQKIQETEQKQLEQGMWNIPEGATVWVPITSLTPANQPQGGGGGGWNAELPPTPEYGPYGPEGPKLPEIATPVGPTGSPSDPIYVVSADNMRKLAGGVTIDGSPADKWKNDWKFRLKNEPPLGVTTQEGYEEPEKITPNRSPLWRLFRGENLLDIIKESFTNAFGGGADQESKPGILGSGVGIAGSGVLSTLTPVFASLNTLIRGLNPIGGNVRTAMKEDTTSVPNLPKMSLALNNTTTLVVDGRVLARAIKPYLIADINRAVSVLGRNITTQA